jgi:pimeloyl-ACP methyl ester carboxylesterase
VLGLQRPHLVVHDVGGTYGLAFTAMYPELISKLTILNTNFFPDWAMAERDRVRNTGACPTWKEQWKSGSLNG